MTDSTVQSLGRVVGNRAIAAVMAARDHSLVSRPEIQIRHDRSSPSTDERCEDETEALGKMPTSPGPMQHRDDVPAPHPLGSCRPDAVQRKVGFEVEFRVAVEGYESGAFQEPREPSMYDDGIVDLQADHTDKLKQDVVNPGALHQGSLVPILEVVNADPIDEFDTDADAQLTAFKDALTSINTELTTVLNATPDPVSGLATWLDDVYPGAGRHELVGGSRKDGQKADFVNLQATYGIRFDKITEAFTAQATQMSSGSAKLYSETLSKSNEVAVNALAWMKETYKSWIYKGRRFWLVNRQTWKHIDPKLLRNYLALLSYLYIGSELIGRPWSQFSQTRKNEFGMFLYKSNLADLWQALPEPVQPLLESKATPIATKIMDLAEPFVAGSLLLTSPRRYVTRDHVARLVQGDKSNLVAAVVKAESQEIPAEEIGRPGEKQLALVVENRQIEKLYGKPKWMSVSDATDIMDDLTALLEEVHDVWIDLGGEVPE